MSDLSSRPTRTLGDRRRLFSRGLAELALWIEDELSVELGRKILVAFDEVTVHSPRAARQGLKRLIVEDGVHKPKSFHHQGLAADLLLYLDLDSDGEEDDYLAAGTDPIWARVGARWKAMHPLFTAGIDFRDPNHVSLGER